MEDVIGLRVRSPDGEVNGFITWGRVFDAVDPAKQIKALRKMLPLYKIDPNSEIELCYSLSDLSAFPYFYEALIQFAAEFPKTRSEKWMAMRRAKIKVGREIYFLGRMSDRLKALAAQATDALDRTPSGDAGHGADMDR